jgi:hypothetical protein
MPAKQSDILEQDMNLDRAVFAFFPYLITRERLRIRGVEFRSNMDIADLPSDVQEHLTTFTVSLKSVD